MHSFRLVPEIRQYDTTKEFCADLHIGMGDLLLISESLYDKFFKLHDKGAIPVFYRKYGSGEPTICRGSLTSVSLPSAAVRFSMSPSCLP